jgi:hypothetical protein
MKINIGYLRFPAALLALSLTAMTRPAMAESETRATAPFHAITFEGSWTVNVVVGKVPSVTLTGDKDVLALVKTEVVDGDLRIGVDTGRSPGFQRVDVGDLTAEITVPELTAFALHGSGMANVADLNGGTTKFEVNGSGDLTAAGKLDMLALVVNGSGQADLSALVATRASATVNGSGDATVNPSESLAAMVNGSGTVSYLGDNPRVTSVVHGSGQVDKH